MAPFLPGGYLPEGSAVDPHPPGGSLVAGQCGHSPESHHILWLPADPQQTLPQGGIPKPILCSPNIRRRSLCCCYAENRNIARQHHKRFACETLTLPDPNSVFLPHAPPHPSTFLSTCKRRPSKKTRKSFWPAGKAFSKWWDTWSFFFFYIYIPEPTGSCDAPVALLCVTQTARAVCFQKVGRQNNDSDCGAFVLQVSPWWFPQIFSRFHHVYMRSLFRFRGKFWFLKHSE